MNLFIWGINYVPEVTGIAPYNTALCEYLAQRGHTVHMFTSFSYYPTWTKQPEDQGRLYRTDLIKGVKVHRCWHYVPRKATALKRIFHEGSFVLTSFLRALVVPRPDVMLVVSPPLLLGAAAWVLSWIKRAPFIFHVKDLQPDAAAELGMLKYKSLLRALYWLEGLAYRKAARVAGINPGMIEAFRRKAVPEDKILYSPDHIDVKQLEASCPPPGTFRKKHGFSEHEFLILYSGNLGVKQGLGILLDAARLVKNPAIRFVICGDGSQREVMVERIRQEKLGNVTLLPLQSQELYLAMLRDADISAITQQPGTGKLFFPNKLLPTLALSRPVIATADGESDLAIAIAQGKFGAIVPPTRPDLLAAAVEDLAREPERLDQWGKAGRIFINAFDRASVLQELEKVLENLSSGSNA
jgi:colanic acid biosynthesis glycosyl transferase WcaI